MNTELNIPLFRKLRTRFLRMRHPKHFNMGVIATKTDCGAAMCFIGHTLDLAGYKMRKRNRPSFVAATLDFDFFSPDGNYVSDVYEEARELLGIDLGDAHKLFNDYSLKTPKQAAERIEQLITGG